MDAVCRELNDLLTGAFDLIVKAEQSTFRGTRFSDLSVAEIHTIGAIGRDERSMGEVAAALDITLATLNASVGRLCAKGYAQRRRTETDRRLVLIKLTRSGQVVYRLHDKFHEKMVARAVEGLDAEECETLAKALSNLRMFFQEITAAGLEEGARA